MTSTAQSRNRSGSISTWYTSSYGNISRTSRLRAPAFMPAGLNNSDAMTADVTIPLDVGASAAGMRGYGQPNAQNDNANAANGATSGTTKSKSKGGKKGETLFGPDLGLDENDSEGWVNRDLSKEKVPLSVVKDWVEKAKKEEQGVHQTTTLQALVNLKRPTLTLIPVPQDEIVPAEAETNDPAASRSSIDRRSAIRHTLRFVYDASSPRVKISISVHPQFSNHGQSRTIYTCIRDGGFGKRWELPHENALDIGQAMEDEKRAEEEMLISLKKLDGDASDASDNEDDLKKPSYAQQQDEQTIQPHVDQLSNEQVINHASQPPRPRTLMERLRRQRRTNDVETGILADIRRQQGGEAIEMRTAGIENVIHGNNSSSAKPQSQEQGGDVKNEEGMRIVIRLDGLDEDGSNLAVTNAQSTHVLLTGTTMGGPASASRAAVAVTEQESGERLGDVQEETAAEEEEIAGSELQRVWYIKVMRREAIIGQHAFLLKEIYGLASTSGNDAPTEDQVENNDDPLASTPNECIVCLTNPRDVVLLPCRHLVVCRECALGMIEFGAGGKVARREDAAEAIADVPAAGDAPTATTSGGDLAVNPTPTVPTTTPRERRKKKAKGWFCPVCRQPYTSLLRLALPANEMTTVDIDAVTSTALSRQPSIGALSVRSTGRSLHRSTSRATLPERGERMLQDIARDHENDEVDDDVEADGQHNQGVPQFIYGQEGNLLGRTPSNAENSVAFGTALPVSISDGHQSSEAQGRSSLEGRGWRQAV